MNGLSCDMCNNELLIDEDIRYVAEIQVYAAYDPMEITASDLKKDFRSAISELIKKLKNVSPQKAQNSVYRAFSFDLCCKCQKKYLKNPLGKFGDMTHFRNENGIVSPGFPCSE